MLFRYLAALISVALVLAACGPTGPERKKCEDGCSASYQCPPGEPNPACEAALIECQDNCADGAPAAHDSPENVSHAASALTVSPSAFYAIAYASGYGPSTGTYCNDPAQSTWCECNVDYTDAAARCNEPTATVFWHFPSPACVVSSATLTYQATEGAAGRTVSIRRILRPVATPPMGLAGSCVTSSVASWWRSGPEAWTTPGAKGDGTDRTATGPSRTLTTTALHTESFDVTALVQGCPASGDCVLAQYADAHVSVSPGAVLDVVCGAPAVCGDGTIVGSETCDDLNLTAGDGCSALCAVEAGYTCSGAPSVCATTCGDGVKAGAEECDNGAANGADAPCSPTCTAQVCGCSPP